MNDGASSAGNENLFGGRGGTKDFSAREHLVDHAGNGSVRVDVADAEAQIGEAPGHVAVEERRHQALVLLHGQDRAALGRHDGTDGGAAFQLLHRLHRRL